MLEYTARENKSTYKKWFEAKKIFQILFHYSKVPKS